VLAASGGKTSQLAVVVLGGDDPVDGGVASDSLVVSVDHNNFVIFECGVLGDPVRIEDGKGRNFPSDTFLEI